MCLSKLGSEALPGKPPADKQCSADSKRTGRRCGAWAVSGRDTCYHHGGTSPIGAGSPNYRDGSRSKYRAIFSGGALDHYEASREDPRYIELREEIALLDTLVIEELMAAKVGEGGALWEELSQAWERFRQADPHRDASTAGRGLRRVGEIIEEGASRHAARREAVDLVERKRRLSETERRRLVDEERMITETRVLAFVGALVAIVNQHVPERERRAAISADIARLMHQEAITG